MKTILVGIDGSDESRAAATTAAQIARRTDSKVDLAYVIPTVAFANSELGPFDETLASGRTTRALMLLETMSQSVPCPAERMTTSLLEGSTAGALAKEAERDDVWLVVVGHRGRGAVQRVLLGSVADRLTQICPKPVMVVR